MWFMEREHSIHLEREHCIRTNIKLTNPHSISSTIKRLFPNHHPHELRYTFITRCKEAGVNPELVMLWDGHSFDKDVKTSVVDRGYTDYSEEYVLAEAEKVNYTF